MVSAHLPQFSMMFTELTACPGPSVRGKVFCASRNRHHRSPLSGYQGLSGRVDAVPSQGQFDTVGVDVGEEVGIAFADLA